MLRSLIVDIVIRQEATKLGLEATPGRDTGRGRHRRAAGRREELRSRPSLRERAAPSLSSRMRSAPTSTSSASRTTSRRRAWRRSSRSLASGANFIATAKQFSDDSGTSANGGDLGVLTAAQLKTYDPNFAAAVEALKVGAYTTTPVHDAGGYDILMLYSKTTKGWGVRHILIYAGNPYNVMDRPEWFAEALFSAIHQLCVANEISVTLTNAGGNPCTSPSPTPTPRPPSAEADAEPRSGGVRCFLAVPLADPALADGAAAGGIASRAGHGHALGASGDATSHRAFLRQHRRRARADGGRAGASACGPYAPIRRRARHTRDISIARRTACAVARSYPGCRTRSPHSRSSVVRRWAVLGSMSRSVCTTRTARSAVRDCRGTPAHARHGLLP